MPAAAFSHDFWQDFLRADAPVPVPQTRRQSNDLNEAWTAAYLADQAARQDH